MFDKLGYYVINFFLTNTDRPSFAKYLPKEKPFFGNFAVHISGSNIFFNDRPISQTFKAFNLCVYGIAITKYGH